MHEDIDAYLQQAGCAPSTCAHLARLAATGHAHEALPQLAEERRRLAAEARDADRRLDCLDQAIRAITGARGPD